MKNQTLQLSYINLSVFVLSILCAAATLFAGPGSLDTTFGTTGNVITGFQLATDVANDAATQSDGKLVLVGQTVNAGFDDCSIIRLNPDGTLDTSFGQDGVVFPILGFGNGSCVANSVAIQGDGKIVVGGANISSNRTSFLLMRFNIDGRPDDSFGNAGIVLTRIGFFSARAREIVIQTDQKIIIAGTANTSPSFTNDFVVARYETDGTLDTTFDNDGIASIDFSGSDDEGLSVAIDTSGNIVVGGTARMTSATEFAVARFQPDGSLDGSFGLGGKTRTLVGVYSSLKSLDVHANGKIVIAGNSYNGTNDEFTIVRYDQNGGLDSTFGNGGIIVRQFEMTYALASSVKITSDEKIIATGGFRNDGMFEFVAFKFNQNGTMDTSFDTDGIKTIRFINGSGFANSILIRSDGKIVLAGEAKGKRGSDFGVVRLNSDGTDDLTFNNSGKTTVAVGSIIDEGLAIEIQNDGKIIQAGFVKNPILEQFGIVRYNVDGTIDETFGDDGFIIEPRGENSEFARDVAIQEDGKIVVAGFVTGLLARIKVARYNSDGTRDLSFGTNGYVLTDFGTQDVTGNALVIQPDGKILVVGRTTIAFTARLAMVRYNYDGTLDTTFGDNGRVSSPAVFSANAVALQNDGKIVIAGRVGARFFSDGSIDSSFGTAGIITLDSIGSGEFNSIAVQPNGKLLFVGTTGHNFTTLRLNDDGSKDISFGSLGVVTTVIGTSFNHARSVALQSNGKIVVGGDASVQLGKTPGLYKLNFAVVRYNYDGSLDTQWGTDGITFVDPGDRGYSLKIDASQRVLLGGTTNAKFGITRLQGDIAPTAVISGRILTSSGIGIYNAVITITGSNLFPVTVRSNNFGYYRTPPLSISQTYQVNLSSKGFSFPSPSLSVKLTRDYPNLDFVGNRNVNLKDFYPLKVDMNTSPTR